MTPREAANALVHEFHLGDFIYSIRSHAVETDPSFTGNSWEHPMVKRFAEAVDVLTEFADGPEPSFVGGGA